MFIRKDIITRKIDAEDNFFERAQQHETAEAYSEVQKAIQKFMKKDPRFEKQGFPLEESTLNMFRDVLFNQKMNPAQIELAVNVFEKEARYRFKAWQALSFLRTHYIRRMIPDLERCVNVVSKLANVY